MRRPVRPPVIATALATALVATWLLSGCVSSSGRTSPPAPGSAGADAGTAAPSGSITVLAAASLTESFKAIGASFEKKHPGTRVMFSFAGSSTLATQITQGAPADVFASASPRNMQRVVDAEEADDPKTFARNLLEIAVPADNPANITQLSDLGRPGVKVAVCAEPVPAGAGARAVFEKARMTVQPVTVEADVKATLAKVTLGEVDAGVVWATDVLSAGTEVRGIAIPADLGYSSDYPIAALTGSENPTLAQAFVDYVLSPDAASILSRTGFESP